MSSPERDISLALRQKHKVDEHFYPKISMDIDIPNGLEGEIAEIVKALKANKFETANENVFHTMELKKKLLSRYTETPEGRKIVARYRRMLLEEIKPAGVTIPIELILVNGLIALVLYTIARFAGSFADESGRIAARRLLEKDKKRAIELNLNIKEYSFLKNEISVLIEHEKTLDSFKEKLKKKSTSK